MMCTLKTRLLLILSLLRLNWLTDHQSKNQPSIIIVITGAQKWLTMCHHCQRVAPEAAIITIKGHNIVSSRSHAQHSGNPERQRSSQWQWHVTSLFA